MIYGILAFWKHWLVLLSPARSGACQAVTLGLMSWALKQESARMQQPLTQRYLGAASFCDAAGAPGGKLRHKSVCVGGWGLTENEPQQRGCLEGVCCCARPRFITL